MSEHPWSWELYKPESQHCSLTLQAYELVGTALLKDLV